MLNLFASKGSGRKQILSFFLFLCENNGTFWRLHPESHLGHCFGTFFWLFISPVVIVVVVVVVVVIIITIFTVTESLIRIGCSFILASLLILSWLW